MSSIVKLLINGIAVYITAAILPGISINDFTTAIIVAVILAAANIFIKPILIIFTLPITIVTLGLFTLIINGFLVILVSSLVTGFVVSSFIWAIIFSLTLSVITTTINFLAREN